MKYPEILAITPPPGEFAYDEQFTILYAVAVGAGADRDELPFVYEKDLRALPTMAVMMGQGSGAFLTGGGIDYARIVHGEQRLTIHHPVPPRGRMTSRSKCLGVVDKGADKGALLIVESTVEDAATGVHHATGIATLFCRGDGGFGGPRAGELPLEPRPERSPDLEVVLPTLPQQAAIYRLTGDRNPLHIDPEAATAAGFRRPILHGLCTYAIACRAILQGCCGNDPALIERFDARFSAPVFPGEAIVTRIWHDGRRIAFECVVAEREAMVIRNGFCLLRE
ncbi:MAG: MaoC family dehydratase N-terminal domain-containing protein [Novosphingobium sp.]|nr:MaoC family dehydratase N-terminal domain-containing protein [Novosphingobium sp.]